ncbi:MAG: hypothetical protein FWD92_00295 [Methanomassiliicoccaceae archaeon]|nr:hypothetical protein [Methanomassiliicoccaceae archaeon]
MKKLSVDLKTEKDLIEMYRLDEVVVNDTIRSNIALTLQYVHFNLDMTKTYDLEKDLKALTFKQLLISTFSVLEGIMLGAIDTLKKWCDSMESCQSKCEFYFKKDVSEYIRFKEMKDHLCTIKALSFSPHGMEFVEIAKDLRNNVHIGKSSELESENTYYSAEFVDRSIIAIRETVIVLAAFISQQKNEFLPALRMCP